MDAFTFELPNEYEEQNMEWEGGFRLFGIPSSVSGQGGAKAVAINYFDSNSVKTVIDLFDSIEDGMVMSDMQLVNVEHLTIDGHEAVVADGIPTDSSKGTVKCINLSDGTNRVYVITVFNYDQDVVETLMGSISVL